MLERYFFKKQVIFNIEKGKIYLLILPTIKHCFGHSVQIFYNSFLVIRKLF